MIQPNKLVIITDKIRKDLKLWEVFLRDFNSRVFIDYMPIELSESLNFYTDASFKVAGGTFQNKWFKIVFPDHWAENKTTYLE